MLVDTLCSLICIASLVISGSSGMDMAILHIRSVEGTAVLIAQRIENEITYISNLIYKFVFDLSSALNIISIPKAPG